MLDDGLRSLAEAQLDWHRRFAELDPSAFGMELQRARDPDEVRKAILKEMPVISLQRDIRLPGPDPAELREEAAAAGVLDASPHDLAFRRLHPALDIGIYGASHAMGKPSMALRVALAEHLAQLGAHGIGAWMHGWGAVVDDLKEEVADLVGGDLRRGDVAFYPNFSEGLSALLSSLRGRLVTTAGHFTTGDYVHEVWSRRTGSEVVQVPLEEDGTLSLERLEDALTPDTAVVSLSHAHYRTGHLVDIEQVSRLVEARCPDAALLVDVYQTAGTVPIGVGILPPRSALIGGGIKQLRAGSGAGYAWISNALLADIEPDRVGWFGHEAPLAFEHGPMRMAERAARLQTGVPSLLPMVALLTELRTLATSAGGNLQEAVRRARRRTREQVADAASYAEQLGLEVVGSRDPERRAAFLAIRLTDGAPVVEKLLSAGLTVDFRSDAPGASAGLLRLSANSASFGYELLFAVERIARHSGAAPG